MMIKYKLSEVAKDFGLSNKEISEILGKYLKAPKSNAQALNEEELDVVFESLTQGRQAADLMAALEATKAAKAAKSEAKKAEEKKPEGKKSEGKQEGRNQNAGQNRGGKPEQRQGGEQRPRKDDRPQQRPAGNQAPAKAQEPRGE